MSITRTQLSRNKKSKQNQKNIAKQLDRKELDLDNICEKHKIGELNFRDCKLVNLDGKISYIDYDQIRGNLKLGIMMVKAKSIEPSINDIYDIVKIINDKKERDSKKQTDELEKARQEIERLQTANNIDMNMPVNAPVNTETIPETKPDAPIKAKNKDNSAKSKRNQALLKLREKLANDKQKPTGNKYFRSFMKDIRSRFVLENQENYQYFDIKFDATDMVIPGVKVYRIIIPNKVYLLLVGDLQIKRGLIKQIDPTYQSDQTIDEQNDFFKKILEKDNIQPIEIDDAQPITDNDDDDAQQITETNETNEKNI